MHVWWIRITAHSYNTFIDIFEFWPLSFPNHFFFIGTCNLFFQSSKLYISLDFKCFLPQNSMEKLISFGIIILLASSRAAAAGINSYFVDCYGAGLPVQYDLAAELWRWREQYSECSNITFFSFLKQIWYLQKTITYFWIQCRKINHLSYWNFRNIILMRIKKIKICVFYFCFYIPMFHALLPRCQH